MRSYRYRSNIVGRWYISSKKAEHVTTTDQYTILRHEDGEETVLLKDCWEWVRSEETIAYSCELNTFSEHTVHNMVSAIYTKHFEGVHVRSIKWCEPSRVYFIEGTKRIES